MKLFIKSFSYFVLLFLGIILLITISTSYIEKNYSSFEFQSNLTYLVVGDSHPECAFNDSLIPNFKNIAESGEAYFYNYSKIKPVILQNPSIKVVFIEYTNNQINDYMNERIWADAYISDRYPRYSSFMNLEENLMLFKNNPSAYTNALSLSIRKKSVRIFKNDLDFSTKIGGYLYLKRDKTDSIINSRTKLKDTASSVTPDTIDISEANLSYLDEIIRFCKINDKKVILIRSPQHKKYAGYMNEEKYKQILNTRYADLEYLDFSNFPLSNSEFGDLTHLNYKGAAIFSEWFANLMNNGLLEKEDKQDYIDQKIKEQARTAL
ncbi:hypothetical protein ACFQ3R_14460 [Mesonia ostreae]|uniref:SGNH/GDSL hydrolase family protein n=1 Tax=Mesonia ostreae TaxID=861110 RepID=A0ABU2KKW5_9FLAO|nr:hypothetical protein [Mesonia ostreae]MDT0295351.1 hypothetical protein [Mesonia ostreae]